MFNISKNGIEDSNMWLKNKYVEIISGNKSYIGVIENCHTYNYANTERFNIELISHNITLYIIENEKLKNINLDIPANKFKINFLPKNDETIFRLKYEPFGDVNR